jgi:hypothetical protein
MLRWIRAVAGVVMLSVTTPATAQPEAFLLVPFVGLGCTPHCGTITRVAPDTSAVLSSVTDTGAGVMTSPYVTPDGRLLVWVAYRDPATGPGRVAVRDLLTGATQTVVVPGFSDILGNPARTELYVIDGTGLFAWSPSGLKRFATPSGSPAFLGGMSGDGRRLLASGQRDGIGVRPSAADVSWRRRSRRRQPS